LFGAAPQGKSLFDTSNSLFGGQSNIFAKATHTKPESEGGDSPVYAEDEPPTVTLGEYKGVKSPFEKVFEKEVQKFKISTPAENKKNCGLGKASVQKGVFAGVAVFKMIHKNTIGKILYDANLSAAHSKCRRVPEKSHKN
jgi:hypothetical protein